MKTRPQFQAALQGQTIARSPHFALHACALDSPALQVTGVVQQALFPASEVWLGAMVPKRWAKRAVTRNAIKRQIYSVSGEFEGLLQQRAHVVRLRASFERKQFLSASSDALKSAVRAELNQLFARGTAVPP
jgi:ribonuclease P protein component